MNRVNALKLADTVLNSTGFDMQHCETCLIGQACVIETGDNTAVGSDYDSGKLCEFLGLDPTDEMRMALYLAMGARVGFDDLTAKHAADMLRSLVDISHSEPITPDAIERAWSIATS